MQLLAEIILAAGLAAPLFVRYLALVAHGSSISYAHSAVKGLFEVIYFASLYGYAKLPVVDFMGRMA